MKFSQIHYDILRTVADLQRCGVSNITVSDVSDYVRDYSIPQIRRAAIKMSAVDWDYLNGAWITLRNNNVMSVTGTGYRSSADDQTGGWLVYREMIEHPDIVQSDTGDWADEVLTGMNAKGQQTDIDNAVMPTGGNYSNYRGDAEEQAWRAWERFGDDEEIEEE